jgi:hypothetical protein
MGISLVFNKVAFLPSIGKLDEKNFVTTIVIIGFLII